MVLAKTHKGDAQSVEAGVLFVYALDRNKDIAICLLCAKVKRRKIAEVEDGDPGNYMKHLQSQYDGLMKAFNICNGTVVAAV